MHPGLALHAQLRTRTCSSYPSEKSQKICRISCRLQQMPKELMFDGLINGRSSGWEQIVFTTTETTPLRSVSSVH